MNTHIVNIVTWNAAVANFGLFWREIFQNRFITCGTARHVRYASYWSMARHANIRPISVFKQNIKNENRKLGFTLILFDRK